MIRLKIHVTTDDGEDIYEVNSPVVPKEGDFITIGNKKEGEVVEGIGYKFDRGELVEVELHVEIY